MSLFGQVCVYDGDERQFLDDVGHYRSETAFARHHSYNAACIYLPLIFHEIQ